jgi:hypothetical protein
LELTDGWRKKKNDTIVPTVATNYSEGRKGAATVNIQLTLIDLLTRTSICLVARASVCEEKSRGRKEKKFLLFPHL